jgi:hypothetical protein
VPSLAAKAPTSAVEPGPAIDAGAPIDHRNGTMSVIAIIESYIATSTYCPRPVASRSRSAASVPITPNSAVEMSPSAPATTTGGG